MCIENVSYVVLHVFSLPNALIFLIFDVKSHYCIGKTLKNFFENSFQQTLFSTAQIIYLYVCYCIVHL